MASALGVGIIGVGYGARVHLPAFQSIDGVKVMALADSGSGRAASIAKQAGVAHGFAGWQDLLLHPGIDIVTIASPPATHAPIIRAALGAGKHILCEKPFCADLRDAQALYRAAIAGNHVHAVGYEFRMEPGISVMQGMVAAGILGEVRRIDVTWLTGGHADPELLWSWQNDAAAGGGVVEAFGSHVVDYIEWLCGDSIAWVMGSSAILIGERRDASGSLRPVTAEDSADLVYGLRRGAVANVRVSNCYPFAGGHRIEVYGATGRMIFSHTAPFRPEDASLQIEVGKERLHPVALKALPTPAGLDTRAALFRQLAETFVRAIRGEAAPDLPDFGRAVRVQAVLQAAHTAILSQRQTPVPETGLETS